MFMNPVTHYLRRALPASLAALSAAAAPMAAADAIEEIVVTVRQRAESIRDVPGSVAAFSEERIEASGVERASDFVNLTPGVSIVDAAEVADTQVNIRGINGARDAETNYALIIDGVLHTNPAALNREYTNLQQIEILKGPQGALYGRNAAAGAIIITTQQPGDQFAARVKGSVAQDDTYVLSGIVSGPITDGLRFSLEADYRDTDGFYEDVFQDRDDVVDNFEGWNVGGRLVWEPTERLSIDTKLRYGEVDAASITFNSVFHLPGLVDLLGPDGFGFPEEFAAFGYENVNGHDFQFNTNIRSFNDQEALEFSVKVDYDLGWADLTGWGLYSDIDNNLGADGTSGAFGFFFTEQQCIDTTAELAFYPLNPPQFLSGDPATSIYGAYTPTACDGTQYQERNQKDYSFELRLSSKSDQALRWLAGVYFLDLEREVGVNTGIDRGAGIINSLFTTDPANPTEQLVWDQFDTNVYAVFGQLAYDFTDTIEGSLALRYDREERDVTSKVPTDAVTQYINTCDPADTVPGGDPINPGLCSGPITPKSETFDEIQPKVSLTWDTTDNLTLYGTVGVGFKSGGFNNQGSAATIDIFINEPLITGPNAPFPEFTPVNIEDQYKEETSTSYEIGLKSELFNNQVRAELALYQVDVDDMQFFEFVVGPFGLLRTVSNIDEVTLKGIEGALYWSATDWLDLYVGGNYTDSEIDKNSARPDTVGNESPYTPEWTANAGGIVVYPLTANLDLTGSIDVSAVGDTWFHVVQDQERPTGFSALFGIAPAEYSITQRDAYTTVNARIGLAGESWSVSVFARNLFDEEYLEEVIPAPEFGGSFIHPGAERRVGVEATYSFGGE